MTLEQQLRALCDQHGLTNLSVDITIRQDGSHYFGSYAHRDGVCASASIHRAGPAEATGEAIANLLAKCGESLVHVPELVAA